MFNTTHGKLTFYAVLAAMTVGAHGVHGQTPADPATAAPMAAFKSSVDLVRIADVVRDHKGRFVQDLTIRDFEVTDGTQVRRMSRASASRFCSMSAAAWKVCSDTRARRPRTS